MQDVREGKQKRKPSLMPERIVTATEQRYSDARMQDRCWHWLGLIWTKGKIKLSQHLNTDLLNETKRFHIRKLQKT